MIAGALFTLGFSDYFVGLVAASRSGSASGSGLLLPILMWENRRMACHRDCDLETCVNMILLTEMIGSFWRYIMSCQPLPEDPLTHTLWGTR